MSPYLSCKARAGGIIFAPILPTRVGNTPTSSTTVICRRSRLHCACCKKTKTNTEGVSMAKERDFCVELQTERNRIGLYLEVYLPTPHCLENS